MTESNSESSSEKAPPRPARSSDQMLQSSELMSHSGFQNTLAMIHVSIDEAYLLLKYITMNKQDTPLPPETIGIVVEARQKVEAGKWDAEIETKFWNALDQLSTTAYPVTVAGLKSIDDSFGEKPWYKTLWHSREKQSAALSTILNYQQMALFTLCLMLMTQIYWITGNNLANGIDSYDKEVSRIKGEIYKVQQTLPEAGADEAQQRNLDLYMDQIEELNTRMESSYEMLAGWNKPWQLFVRPFSNLETLIPNLSDSSMKTKDKERAMVSIRQMTQFALESLYDYFLPLFYGLLGALTFTLQTLNRDITARVFSQIDRLGLRLRLQLGVLSGLAVGWFVNVDNAQSLTPLTLAFLGGYSVDLLFSTMNRLISNFTTPEQKKS